MLEGKEKKRAVVDGVETFQFCVGSGCLFRSRAANTDHCHDGLINEFFGPQTKAVQFVLTGGANMSEAYRQFVTAPGDAGAGKHSHLDEK